MHLDPLEDTRGPGIDLLARHLYFSDVPAALARVDTLWKLTGCFSRGFYGDLYILSGGSQMSEVKNHAHE